MDEERLVKIVCKVGDDRVVIRANDMATVEFTPGKGAFVWNRYTGVKDYWPESSICYVQWKTGKDSG